MFEKCECGQYHDEDSLHKFIEALSRASVYHSWDTGDVIDDGWKDEAELWLKHLVYFQAKALLKIGTKVL